MKSIFEPEAVEDLFRRIEKLHPGSAGLWGKMNVAQMLAHCADGIYMAMGKINPPTSWIGRTVGRWVRSVYFNDKPFSKNIKTIKGAAVVTEKDFETEKTRLKQTILAMHTGGEKGCTTHPHALLGPFNAEEWGKGMYKHLDHHLRQFGA